MRGPAIAVAGLRYTYPDGTEALAGLDFEADHGERVALLGPNGAGKTTLALHLNGIHRPEAGTVTVGELTVSDATLAEVRRRVQLVFQDPDDQLFMPSVRDDVAFGPANLGMTGDELDDRVAAALAAVGAEQLAGRAPHHLSGGERRRAALATVLAMDPDVLVLDEPNAGLDPVGQRELVDVLATLSQTQLVITHDLSFALRLCERGVIIDGGRTAADRPLTSLLADEQLLAAHGLELPYGFDLRTVQGGAP